MSATHISYGSDVFENANGKTSADARSHTAHILINAKRDENQNFSPPECLSTFSALAFSFAPFAIRCDSKWYGVKRCILNALLKKLCGGNVILFRFYFNDICRHRKIASWHHNREAAKRTRMVRGVTNCILMKPFQQCSQQLHFENDRNWRHRDIHRISGKRKRVLQAFFRYF